MWNSYHKMEDLYHFFPITGLRKHYGGREKKFIKARTWGRVI